MITPVNYLNSLRILSALAILLLTIPVQAQDAAGRYLVRFV
jgi:hypothetical protein